MTTWNHYRINESILIHFGNTLVPTGGNKWLQTTTTRTRRTRTRSFLWSFSEATQWEETSFLSVDLSTIIKVGFGHLWPHHEAADHSDFLKRQPWQLEANIVVLANPPRCFNMFQLLGVPNGDWVQKALAQPPSLSIAIIPPYISPMLAGWFPPCMAQTEQTPHSSAKK